MGQDSHTDRKSMDLYQPLYVLCIMLLVFVDKLEVLLPQTLCTPLRKHVQFWYDTNDVDPVDTELCLLCLVDRRSVTGHKHMREWRKRFLHV